jgi:hypothetical protein
MMMKDYNMPITDGIYIDASNDHIYEKSIPMPCAIEIGESKDPEYYEEMLVNEVSEILEHRRETTYDKLCYSLSVVMIFGVFIILLYLFV